MSNMGFTDPPRDPLSCNRSQRALQPIGRHPYIIPVQIFFHFSSLFYSPLFHILQSLGISPNPPKKRTRIEDEDENMVNRKRRRRRAGCWELRKIQWPIVLMWYLSSELRAERERERGEEIVRGIWAKTEMNKWEEAGKKEIYIKCVYCNHLKRKEHRNIYKYILYVNIYIFTCIQYKYTHICSLIYSYIFVCM